jgi:transposase
MGELMMILELHRQGLSPTAIARQLGIDRKTVRRYIARGMEPPCYRPAPRRARCTDGFLPYLRDRLAAYPGLTAVRLLREVQERGFTGSYTALKRAVQELRPDTGRPFEVRFETPPGEQAQVDLARFEVTFADEPGAPRVVWLFSMVLGFSRLIWAQFVVHQDLQSVLRCHVAAFTAIGGVPREVLYDRMKTAVIGEDAEGLVVYNRGLIDLARHFGFQPKACRPYRPQTKGKVERPFRYIREDFFLARSFRNLDDLNAQLRHWLDTVANPRTHATTRRVVNEAFAEERTALRPLPLAAYRTVLKLERRVSHEGMVRVGGNAYSVPDTARRRVLEVHCLVDEVRIFEDGEMIACHAALPGRGQTSLDPAHRKAIWHTRRAATETEVVMRGAGDVVARRSLEFYDALGRVMATKGNA